MKEQKAGNLPLHGVTDPLNRCLPRYRGGISSPYQAIKASGGDCLSLALSAKAIDHPGLSIVRHSLSSGEIYHYVALYRTGLTVPTLPIINRAGFSGRVKGLSVEDYIEEFAWMVNGKRSERFFREATTELIGKIINGEVDKTEAFIKPNNPNSLRLRLNIINPKAALKAVVSGKDDEPADFGRLADFIIKSNDRLKTPLLP